MTTLTAQIEAARKAGDWDKHADLWEQRRIAEVDAEESSLTELSDHPFSTENIARESGRPDASERHWLCWLEDAEEISGLEDLDGDQSVDGYSLDFAFDAFRAGVSPGDYVASFQGRGR